MTLKTELNTVFAVSGTTPVLCENHTAYELQHDNWLTLAGLFTLVSYIFCCEPIASTKFQFQAANSINNFQNWLFTECPRSVSVMSSNDSLETGVKLMCMSDGDPEPSYTWTDSQGVVLSTGPVIILTQSHYILTCTATSDFSPPCTASKTVYNTTVGT